MNDNDMLQAPAWASFREIVAGIVRSPLEDVQEQVTEEAGKLAKAVDQLGKSVHQLDEEVQDGQVTLNGRLARLDDAIQQHAAANGQHHAEERESTEQLRRSLVAAVTTFREIATDVQRRQGETEHAMITLETRLSRQTVVLMIGFVILLLTPVIVALIP